MKRNIAWLLLTLMLLSVCTACGGTADGEATDPPHVTSDEAMDTAAEETTAAESEAAEEIVLVRDGESLAPIVRSDLYLSSDNATVRVITAFHRTLYTLTGRNMEYKTDYVGKNETYDPASVELLVGTTNREESKALADEMPPYSYAIRTTENKVVIVASNTALLERALAFFVEQMQSGLFGRISTGEMAVKKGIEVVVDCSEEYALDIALRSSNTLQASSTLVTTVLGPSNSWAQGGYTDGTYYYQAFIVKDTASNEANNTVTLVKWEMENGVPLKEVSNVVLNHANDLTYNPNTNQFIVCHNKPFLAKISFVDAETLEVVGYKMLAYDIYCIDYNAARNEYVVGVCGGPTIRVLDENFNHKRGPYQPTRRTDGYVLQGVACDESYIYFVLYKQNVITVYDWSGNFITLIRLDVGSIEPENISVVDKVIYVGCGSAKGKASVFRIDTLTPLPPEEEPPETTSSNEDA